MSKHPIRIWREAQDPPLTLEAVGKKLHTSYVTIWRWENGVSQIPPERAKQLEALTGIPKGKLRPDLWSEAA